MSKHSNQMKYIFSLLLLITLAGSGWAQVYTPVIVNGNVFFKTQLETAEGLLFAEVTVANFEQINGQLYNRTFLKRGFEPDMLVGHLREEPENGRLYFRPLQDPQDILVYDISLDVGDQIELPARWCDGQPGNVAEVIAVRRVSGRRELTFNRTVGESLICDTLRFIEGVGPTATVIYPYFENAVLDNGVAMSLCHAARGGTNVFYPPAGTEDFCGLAITDTEELTDAGMPLFYPNPVRELLYLRHLPADVELEIYGPDGRPYLRSPATTQLDLSSLPAGLLHIVCRRAGRIWHTARILKL